MWLWRLWRWLCGEVRFRAEGGLCERFLNLAAEASPPVELWDILPSDGAVTASCRMADYGRLRPFARRTGSRVRAVRSSGAIKPLRPLRKRPGLLVGAAVAMAIYMLLATRIWVVDIAVEDDALAAAVAQEMAQHGLTVGASVRSVDPSAVRLKTVAALDEVHQISVYFDGCIARVDVTLEEDHHTVPDTNPANIVAAFDGRVIAMRVSIGQAVVKTGEAVVKGDLLVSGAVETGKGVLLRHATAVITAETERVLCERVSLREYLPRAGRVYSRPTLRFLMWEIPLYTSATLSGEWTQTTQQHCVTLFDTALPVGVETTVYTEQTTELVEHSRDEAQALAKERLTARAVQEFSAAQITDVHYEGYWEGDTYVLTATYDCVEDIAATVPLLTEAE